MARPKNSGESHGWKQKQFGVCFLPERSLCFLFFGFWLFGQKRKVESTVDARRDLSKTRACLATYLNLTSAFAIDKLRSGSKIQNERTECALITLWCGLITKKTWRQLWLLFGLLLDSLDAAAKRREDYVRKCWWHWASRNCNSLLDTFGN